MLKNIIAIFIFSTTFVSLASSQILQHEDCGFKDKSIFSSNSYINTETISLFLDSCNYNPNTGKIRYRIPVKFWIYRKSNGKGGLTLKEIKNHIKDLNYYYSTNYTGISFYLHPEIEYIDSDKLYKLGYYKQAPFQTLKRKCEGCINVYITEKLLKPRLFKVKKNYSGTYNTLTEGIIIAKGISSSTLSHEIGHFFGLKHPHIYWKNKFKGEPVSRTKLIPGTNTRMCEKKGDGLCDTPAEPNLGNYTDDKCKYTGWNVKDKYGVVYKPNTNNIMSYTQNRECRKNFTDEQKALMLYTASKKRYSEEWSVNYKNSTNFIADYFEPDDYREMASEIFLRTKQTHTFHKIFSPKKNDNFEDNEDWLYFNLNVTKAQNIEILISNSKYNFRNLDISIYKNNNLIKQTSVDKNNNTINLLKLKKGRYYIKIKPKTTNNTISGYQIKVDYLKPKFK